MSQTCANNSIHNESNFNCDLNENFNINDYQVFTKCKGFKILHFNAQNIIRKIDEFKILCSILLPDILCICESWLTQLQTSSFKSLVILCLKINIIPVTVQNLMISNNFLFRKKLTSFRMLISFDSKTIIIFFHYMKSEVISFY